MFSREKQRELLLQLREIYPAHAYYNSDNQGEIRELAATLQYLKQHGLCNADVQISPDGFVQVGFAAITARGLDFLADDGGLSAILDVVTVRLHADTVRDLIAAKIEATAMPAEEKSALKRRLAALPQKALEVATTDLMRTGLDHLPDAAHWLSKLLGL